MADPPTTAPATAPATLPATEPAIQPDGPDYNSVCEEHRLLQSLVGEWEASCESFDSDGKSVEKRICKEKVVSIYGGRYVEVFFEGVLDGKPYEGKGVIGYDRMRKKYVNHWVDNSTTVFVFMEGSADKEGKTLTLNSETRDNGVISRRRDVYTFGEKTRTYEVYATPEGMKEFKNFVVTYKRLK